MHLKNLEIHIENEHILNKNFGLVQHIADLWYRLV